MKATIQSIGSIALSALLFAGVACSSSDDDDGDDGLPLGTGGTTPVATGGVMMMAATGGKGVAGMTAGTGGKGTGGMMPVAGSGGMAAGGSGGMMMVDAGTDAMMPMGMGACCMGGDCLCHGEPPAAVTSDLGPFKTDSYDVPSAGCIFYPTDAEPPFAAVAISDGLGGSGGCGPSQTGDWGPLYASWGIVAMIVHTGAGDQPAQRGTKLTAGVAAFKMENTASDSPLFGKLSGRYGTSGFSMGGGGTTFAAADDPTLKTNVGIMAYGPTRDGVEVASLYIFGSQDGLANTMGMTTYTATTGTVPKMTVTVDSPHYGQPDGGNGGSGKAGLAFQKVYLEGDERWLPLLKSIKADDSANIN